jgi:hypothetical protein
MRCRRGLWWRRWWARPREALGRSRTLWRDWEKGRVAAPKLRDWEKGRVAALKLLSRQCRGNVEAMSRLPDLPPYPHRGSNAGLQDEKRSSFPLRHCGGSCARGRRSGLYRPILCCSTGQAAAGAGSR